MRIISRRALREFWEKHPQAEGPLRAWYSVVSRASWDGPGEVRAELPRASFLSENRILFRIAGNKYRLLTRARYKMKTVFILWIGTHAEYDDQDF